MLPEGQQAPIFQAESTQGRIDLGDYVGRQPIVLIFYPKNDTPVCTKQLCAVRDAKQDYDACGALVLGINPAPLDGHRAFARQYRYDFPLIADEGEEINRKYDVGAMFLRFIGQKRTVYVIDLEGKIAYARRGNPPTGDILRVLQTIVHT